MSNWRAAIFVSWSGTRSGVARGGSRRTSRDRRRLGVPRTGVDPLPHLLRDPRDAGRDGIDHAVRHPLARLEDDDVEAREDAGRVSMPPRRRSRGSRCWCRRNGCATTQRNAFTARTDSGHRFRARLDDGETARSRAALSYQRLRRELLDAEREALIALRRSGAISNDVWLRVGRDLDLEDQRLDI